ncbi:hypothetical protein PR202_ga16134 [Eleusine coracana subsp. coracana]|uniref:Uncharacterized protein n=1 Tax=Eleusine coracana subsp. coracana TaxID=191504 RepID=A0AAV5CLZ8_ELECO|nr:hypothetical protein PR202_ga16134 [Eleusine coracana subsp. coracana]
MPPVFVPASPVVVDNSAFSLNFFPGAHRKGIIDSRGSLLLLNSGPWRFSTYYYTKCACLWFLGAFLLDATGDGDAMSSFRVLYVLYQYDSSGISHTARAFVFGPGSQGVWHIGWHTTEDDVRLPSMEKITFLYPNKKTRPRSGSRSYPLSKQEDELLASGLCGTRLPAGLPGWDGTFLLQPARIVAAGDTFVVLTPVEKTWLFSVDQETMELERDHERNRHVGQAYPCSSRGVVGNRRHRQNRFSSMH